MSHPSPAAVIELLKPVTWFAPMWAFGCGVVSAGVGILDQWALAVAGIVLAGPLLCATSQAVNDWFDRDVDAINEPDRPIPSGRIPGLWGLYIAVAWTALSLIVAAALGPWVLVASVLGVALAWAYSAPPLRLKRNAWLGPGAVALSYEGLAWFTGAAVMLTAFPDWRIVVVAALYSAGAHGIMTLNDFKAVEGDRQTGVVSLPVLLGVDRAARLACFVMALPQVVVIALLVYWQQPVHAIAVGALLAGQGGLMVYMLQRPRERTPLYNATGTTLYVIGMLVTAFALRSIGAPPA